VRSREKYCSYKMERENMTEFVSAIREEYERTGQ
jgi:hypothetical protein